MATNYPDLSQSPEEKMSKKFFLDYGKALYSNFSQRGFRVFNDASENFDVLLSYLRGDQPIGGHFTQYDDPNLNDSSIGMSSAHDSTSWQPLAIAAKYFEIAINAVVERDFDINAKAIDSVAITEMSDRKNRMKAYMKMRKNGDFKQMNREPTSEEIGVNTEKIPETEEELNILFNMNEKHWAAMEAEIAANAVFEMNQWEGVAREHAKNSVAHGIFATLVENKNGNILTRSLNTENLVVSTSNYEDFRDASSAGFEDLLSYPEFMSDCDYPDHVKKKIWEVAAHTGSRDQSTATRTNVQDSVSDKNTEKLITILRFFFKDYHETNYEKQEKPDGSKRIYKLGDTSKPKKSSSKVYADGYNVIKKANWILGWTEDEVIEGVKYSGIYGESICENMEVSDGTEYDVELPIKIVAPRMTRNRVVPLVYTVKPIIDKMQDAWLRHQQYIKEAVPDGNAINLWALEEANFVSGGKTLDASELYKLYRTKGDLLYHLDLEEMNASQVAPIQAQSNGNLQKATEALNQVFQYLNLLREATGLNDVVGASDPDPKMLVGTAEMASQASDNALGYLFRGAKIMKEKVARAIVKQIQNQSLSGEYPNSLRNALGADSEAFWKKQSKVHLHQIGLVMEMKPTRKEWELFYQMMSNSLGKGSINESDMLFLARVDNLKQAEQLFRVRIERREREAHERQKELIDQQNQGQAQNMQMKARMDDQMNQSENNAELQKELVLKDMDMKMKDKEMKAKMVEGIMKDKRESSADSNKHLVNLLTAYQKNKTQ